MKAIKETPGEHHWPRWQAKEIKCRKDDLVVRITDWTLDKDEPAYDVELYIGGVYDWNESETFTTKNHTPPRSNKEAKTAAIEFAQKQIAKLL